MSSTNKGYQFHIIPASTTKIYCAGHQIDMVISLEICWLKYRSIDFNLFKQKIHFKLVQSSLKIDWKLDQSRPLAATALNHVVQVTSTLLHNCYIAWLFDQFLCLYFSKNIIVALNIIKILSKTVHWYCIR